MAFNFTKMMTDYFRWLPVEDSRVDNFNCTVTIYRRSATAPTSSSSRFGHNLAANTTVESSVKCRIRPILGRFNRLEGVMHNPFADADYQVTMDHRTGLLERDFLTITAAADSSWVGKSLEIMLVVNTAGDARITQLACNEVRNG